ncbi:glycosyltransferase [Flammeovirga agarivorans]|uniref:Glycosyltransferase n=1 Tax=Flammeovirga agarivorans TaxID=2726742 RepID=A0A7X8SGM7_9BACT|nr:glycosyltransferase [Flammeovirga agarivorans]NLR89904.1 glycosyltransferase [Flammeovirga agarivorans]
MTNTPLVTVICLSYNQEKFVEKTLLSIKQQNYSNIEIIIVDDASNDDSVNVILSTLQKYDITATFIQLEENKGNCKAFNKALSLSKGEYIIDLAADDILLPNRIKDDVGKFQQCSDEFAAVFSDISTIDENDKLLAPSYFKRDTQGALLLDVIEGDVYERVLSNPPLFSAPTITFKAKYLLEMGGYDETLAYEDFDIWIRLARKYKFAFYDEINTQKREVRYSLGKQFYKKRGNQLLRSTLRICLKAKDLNRNRKEDLSLANSVRYHAQLAFFTENYITAKAFYSLLFQLVSPSLRDRCLLIFLKNKVSLSKVYSIFLSKRGKS